MSHYTVAVFTKPGGKSVDELLAPFDENIQVAPYVRETKAEIIAKAREKCDKLIKDMKTYAEADNTEELNAYWLESEHINPPRLHKYWAEILNYQHMTDEQVYAANVDEDEDYNENGDRLSTYNPNSKWDWYSEGGRWSGLLRIKSGEKVDTALVKEIDFSPDPKEYEYLKHWYEVVVEGKPMNAGDVPDNFKELFGKEYYIERYKDADDYATKETAFHTFALLTPEGVWHEPGQMGWFACDDSTPESQADYDKFFDEFIKNADPELSLTIIDCHI